MSLPSRRRFLNTSLGVAAAMSGGTLLAADVKAAAAERADRRRRPVASRRPSTKSNSLDGANDRINIAVIGCRRPRAVPHQRAARASATTPTSSRSATPTSARLDRPGRSTSRRRPASSPRCTRTSASCSRTRRSTPSASPRPTTGTRWRHLGDPGGQGRVRREADQPQHVEGRRLVEFARKHNKIVLHGTQSRSMQAMHQAMQFIHDGRPRQGHPRPRPVLQEAAVDRQGRRRPADPRERRLRPLVRPGPEDAAAPQEAPLRLALVLGHRQRRHRQPGRPPDGHRASGASTSTRSPTACSASAAGSATSTTARRPTRSSPCSTTTTAPRSSSRSAGWSPSRSRARRTASCNIFYGTEGTLVVNDYGDCTAYAPDGTEIEMPAYDTRRHRQPLHDVHQGRPEPQARLPRGRSRSRARGVGDVPHGEHQLPAGRE